MPTSITIVQAYIYYVLTDRHRHSWNKKLFLSSEEKQVGFSTMLSLVNSLVDFLTETEEDETQDLRYKLITQKCLCDGSLYEDEDFPAAVSSLYTEEKPTDYNVEDVVWLRPKEIVAKAEDPEASVAKFVKEEPTRFDVQQGVLGDCWLLGSIANLPTYKSVYERVVPTDNTEFEDENYCGVFHFRFWQYGQWVDVVIDDRLPTQDGKLIFVSSEHKNVFWSALLEKAYAKLHRSYQQIEGGWTVESFEDFTGGLAEYFRLTKYEKEADAQELFDHIKFSLDHNSLIGISTDADDKLLQHGIVGGHAYSLTGAEKVSNGTLLVRIRNPWGNDTEWTGAWCDGSKEWNVIDAEEREDLGLTFDADGEYWMTWADCRKYLPDLEIGHFNPFCVMCVGGNKERVDSSTIHMSIIEGAWSANDIVEIPEETEENVEGAENDEQDGGNEEEKVDENPDENEVENVGEDLEKNSEEEEAEVLADDVEDAAKEEDAEEITENGPNSEENVEEEEEPTHIEATQSSDKLAKSIQYILSLTKPETCENDEQVFTVVFSIMLKNRRKMDQNLGQLDFHLYNFDKNERSLSEKLNEEFFDNNKQINGKGNYNCANEMIYSYKVPAGEYCVVLTSGIEKEYFVRCFSEANVKTHQLLNTSDDENEI